MDGAVLVCLRSSWENSLWFYCHMVWLVPLSLMILYAENISWHGELPWWVPLSLRAEPRLSCPRPSLVEQRPLLPSCGEMAFLQFVREHVDLPYYIILEQNMEYFSSRMDCKTLLADMGAGWKSSPQASSWWLNLFTRTHKLIFHEFKKY